jgi:MFS family permease
MIESFGIPKASIGKYAGLTSATFSLAQCTTAIFWGRASDMFGRKPIILWGLCSTMVFTTLWGFSANLTWAIACRALSGGGSGNVGIIRTMVAEMVPEKVLQPRAFSVMPLVWSLGSILGPGFGGFFSNPVTSMPGLFGGSKLLARFPFALPNLIAAAFFFVGVIVGFLFLKETLETKKHRRDIGIVIGQKVAQSCSKRRRGRRHVRHGSYDDDELGEALLHNHSRRTSVATIGSATGSDFNGHTTVHHHVPHAPPSVWEVFTRQSSFNLLAYTFLALHSMSFDQLLPIFMHHPKEAPPAKFNPILFTGGFGLPSSRIGTLFTAYGILGGIIQFFLFPPVAKRFGVLRCYRWCSAIIPLVYLCTPYTALISRPALQQGTMFALMAVKCVCGIFSFPCSTIMLTNSATSLRLLGTLNGVATAVSGLGRAIGPLLSGVIFSWGVQHRCVGIAWWVLALIGWLGCVPVWCLVEMDGFNGASASDDEDDDFADEDEEGVLLYTEGDLDAGVILDGDETHTVRRDDDAIDTVVGPPLAYIDHRMGVASVARRMSSPVGLRGEGIGPGERGRRLSTNLGYSNYGQGTGGTTFG